MKKAFTLIELLISVFLLGLIINFLYTAIGTLQNSNQIFYDKSNESYKNQKIINLLYDDIFLSKSIKITGRKDSFLDLQTSNSIYDIDQPYVTWILGKSDNILMRFESVLEFSKMTSENNYIYHITEVAKDCERFHIYQSKDKNNILIDIKLKDQERLVYEFYKPMQIDSNKTKDSNKTHIVEPTR
jgi:prepilin-type N-terminal cleavage/methylation domain-containing protein